MVRHVCLTLACLLGAAAFSVAETAAPTDLVNCRYRESNEVALRVRAEAACLSRLSGIAARIGDTLEIKLRNGDTKTFISNYEACEDGDSGHCVQYWLSAYLPKQRAVVLTVGLWESGEALLVNIDSGNATILEEEPHPSPNGERFAVVKASEYESVTNHIAIYTATSDPPVLEFARSRRDDTYALYSFVRWEGEARIKLKIYTRVKGRPDPKEFDTEAVRTEAGWRLRGPLPGPVR